MGTGLSLAVHIGLLVLLLFPVVLSSDLSEIEQGAGGQGPAGGGGGGNRGTGALRAELLRFVRIAPPAPVAQPAVVPPTEQPKPIPEPQLTSAVKPPELETVAPATGVGGGTGTDVAGGTGSGSGGGVGSGTGTGTGSGVGAGTGGGRQENYPPTAIEMFIPPMPVPPSVRGAHIVAEFDVDETGRVRGLQFTSTRDRGYDRRLREVLEGYRFRPGTRPDGTPVRMKFQFSIDLP